MLLLPKLIHASRSVSDAPDDPDCCIADLNLDGVVGLIDQLLMGSAMVESVPVTAVR